MHQIQIDRISWVKLAVISSGTLRDVSSANVARFLENETQYRWQIRAGNAAIWDHWSVNRNLKNGR